MNWIIVDKIIKNALEEDIPNNDITSSSIISINQTSSIELISKDCGIICGLSIFERVFNLIGNVQCTFNISDGDSVISNQIIGTITGNTLSILKGERLALNLLQHMSGIATSTYKYVAAINNNHTKILDTRKTTPGLRILEKYAVKIGGGLNHRFDLSQGILIKDNHIKAAGSITNAIKLARTNSPFISKIEIETETLSEVAEALEGKADIIMLDNMNPTLLSQAVKLIDNGALTEASGNITLDNISEIANTGVDFISIGALTHSVKAFDISLKNLNLINN